MATEDIPGHDAPSGEVVPVSPPVPEASAVRSEEVQARQMAERLGIG